MWCHVIAIIQAVLQGTNVFVLQRSWVTGEADQVDDAGNL
jgi:hypothetical protein